MHRVRTSFFFCLAGTLGKKRKGGRMRKNLWQQWNENENSRLLPVDVHDFLEKSVDLEDNETLTTLGVTHKDVQTLKHRMRK
jgi:hypothetical protein